MRNLKKYERVEEFVTEFQLEASFSHKTWGGEYGEISMSHQSGILEVNFLTEKEENLFPEFKEFKNLHDYVECSSTAIMNSIIQLLEGKVHYSDSHIEGVMGDFCLSLSVEIDFHNEDIEQDHYGTLWFNTREDFVKACGIIMNYNIEFAIRNHS